MRAVFLAGLLLFAVPLAAEAAMSAAQRAAILAPTGDFSQPEHFETLPGGSATNRTLQGRRLWSRLNPGRMLDSDRARPAI